MEKTAAVEVGPEKRKAIPGLFSRTPLNGPHRASRMPGRWLGRAVGWTLALTGGTLAGLYVTDTRAQVHELLTTPLLHALMDAEHAHRATIWLAGHGLAPRERVAVDDARLGTTLFGRALSNPLGLAAGYDKNGEAVNGLLDMGFGAVEVGTVTWRPQPGNARPRVFRLPAARAVVNRYGLNSEGAHAVAARLDERQRRFLACHGLTDGAMGGRWRAAAQEAWAAVRGPSGGDAGDASGDDVAQAGAGRVPSWAARAASAGRELWRSLAAAGAAPLRDALSRDSDSIANADAPAAIANTRRKLGVPGSLRSGKLLGINIGRNTHSVDGDDDLMRGAATLAPFADYLVVNASCPNVGGTAAALERDALRTTLQRVRTAAAAGTPVVAKLPSDASDELLQNVAQLARDGLVDGVVLGNTTLSRPGMSEAGPDAAAAAERGGLSGPPLRPLALGAVRRFYALTSGAVPIIGVGGIETAADALEFARAGASIVQLYTSLAYSGPGLPTRLKGDLSRLLESLGTTWAAEVGAEHR